MELNTASAPQTEAREWVQVQALTQALNEAHRQNVYERIKKYPQHVNRASSIGHNCERYLYYSRVNWADRDMHSVELQGIFDLGNKFEEITADDITQACRRISEINGQRVFFMGQQTPFVDEKAELSGHIDGAIYVGDYAYPTEFKSVNPNIFPTIKTLDDIRNSPKSYMRSYYAQIQSYLFLFNKQFGLIILKCKSTGALNIIPVELDFAYYESIVQKAERVNAAVQAKVPPERNIDFDTCTECAFKRICFEGAELTLPVVDNDVLLDAIQRKESLADAHRQYEAAAKIVKDQCNRSGLEQFNVGEYIVSRKFVEKGPQEATTYWTNTVKHRSKLK